MKRIVLPALMLFAIACDSETRHEPTEPAQEIQLALQGNPALGDLRHLLLNYAASLDDVVLEQWLVDTDADTDSFRFRRLQNSEVLSLLQGANDDVATEIRSLANSNSAFVGQLKAPREDGVQREFVFAYVPSGLAAQLAIMPSGGGFLGVETTTHVDEDGCNDQGCGCNQPAPITCTYEQGEHSGPSCGCSVSTSQRCYGACEASPGCDPCGSGAGVQSRSQLQSLLDNSGFWTDPAEAGTYLFNTTPIMHLSYGSWF
jgi:hypothetical protein